MENKKNKAKKSVFEFSREAMLGLPDGVSAANLTDAEFPREWELVYLRSFRPGNIVMDFSQDDVRTEYINILKLCVSAL